MSVGRFLPFAIVLALSCTKQDKEIQLVKEDITKATLTQKDLEELTSRTHSYFDISSFKLAASYRLCLKRSPEFKQVCEEVVPLAKSCEISQTPLTCSQYLDAHLKAYESNLAKTTNRVVLPEDVIAFSEELKIKMKKEDPLSMAMDLFQEEDIFDSELDDMGTDCFDSLSSFDGISLCQIFGEHLRIDQRELVEVFSEIKESSFLKQSLEKINHKGKKSHGNNLSYQFGPSLKYALFEIDTKNCADKETKVKDHCKLKLDLYKNCETNLDNCLELEKEMIRLIDPTYPSGLENIIKSSVHCKPIAESKADVSDYEVCEQIAPDYLNLKMKILDRFLDIRTPRAVHMRASGKVLYVYEELLDYKSDEAGALYDRFQEISKKEVKEQAPKFSKVDQKLFPRWGIIDSENLATSFLGHFQRCAKKLKIKMSQQGKKASSSAEESVRQSYDVSSMIQELNQSCELEKMALVRGSNIEKFPIISKLTYVKSDICEYCHDEDACSGDFFEADIDKKSSAKKADIFFDRSAYRKLPEDHPLNKTITQRNDWISIPKFPHYGTSASVVKFAIQSRKDPNLIFGFKDVHDECMSHVCLYRLNEKGEKQLNCETVNYCSGC